jgi:D-alanyl-D-alanine carboxypeptidase (penicillin-binding protein 5/6)
MFQNRFFRRAAALVLTLALAAAAALPGLAAYPMPIQTASETEAVYLFNADTGKTILAQNADQQQYVASLTKMMTALLLLESGKDLNGEVTVPTAMTQEFKDIQNANGMTAGLRIGETVRRIDLLYALLVSSANDAASVIAYDVGGSVLDFVRQMNARAAELGCTGTNFTCAHGLFDYGNVSTAEDMARIAAECYKNPTFVQVSGTAAYTMPATNLHQNERTINSTNPLTDTGSEFYRSYIKCVKGGFTTLAGRCAVAFAEQGGHTYGLVILHADNASLYTECDQLLDWAFESFSDRPLVDTETELTTVDLTKCRAQPTAALYAAAPVSGYGHADDVVSYAFDLPESIPATVKNGQKVGTATVYLDGYEVGTVDLVTHAEYISDFRTDSKATLLLLCTLVVILGALTVLTLAAGGGSLNLRRRKRRH